MIENSLLFRTFSRLWYMAALSYDKSLLRRVINAFGGFCAAFFGKSFAGLILFENLGAESSFEKGFMGRCFAALSGFFQKLSAGTGGMIKSSLAVGYITKLCGAVLCLPVRQYASFFLTFGLTALAGLLLTASASGFMFYTALACVVLGAALMPLRSTIAQIALRSRLISLGLGFFGLERLDASVSGESFHCLFIFLGAAFGAAAAIISPLHLLLAGAGLGGFAAVMYKTEIGVFATAFLIPLVPTMYVLAAAALTVFSFLCRFLLTGSVRLRFQLVDLFVVLFAMMLALSPLVSYMKGSTLVVASTYLLFIAFYFAVKNLITSKEQLFALFSFLALSGLIVSLIGVYQQLTGNFTVTEAWIDGEMFGESISRIYSTLDNPNVLGEYLLFVIPFAFAALYYFKKPVYKLTALGILGAALLCMLFCQSRGAWLGLIAAAGIFILLNDRRLIWLVAALIPLMLIALPESILARFASIGNLMDTSTSYRVYIWLATLVMIRQFWLCGIGLGTESFEFIYQKYAYNAVYAPHSHNLFLQITVDLGIAGLIIFVLMMLSYFKSMLITLKKTKDRLLKPLSAALCASMAGYLVQGLTDNVWYNYRVVIYFWLVMAIAGAIKNLNVKEEAQA